MKNYEDYRCTDCGRTGFKLWRDYGYCDELWCAICCEKKIKAAEEKHPPNPWDDPPGPLDMMRYGFSGVAAIPTDGDCDSYQSAGALKADQLLWWHALPTYPNENDEIRTVMAVLRDSREDLGREERAEAKQIQKVNSLLIQLGKMPKSFPTKVSDAGYGYKRELADVKRVLLETLKLLYDVQGRRLELYNEQSDCEWLLTRKVYMVLDPIKVTIWGTKTTVHEMENGKFLRITGGENQPMELSTGTKIAVSERGAAVVLLGDSWKECPSIMDHDQDGRALADRLLYNRKVVQVRSF